MPSRRDLLAGSTTVLAAGLAGCVGSVPLVGGHPEVRDRSDDPLERNISLPSDGEWPETPFVTLVVGDGPNDFDTAEELPHQGWVWNRTDGTRDVSVAIAGGPDADPWFEQRYEFAPDATLGIELRTPRQYSIRVRSNGDSATVAVPESWFDCNASAHGVLVTNGDVETTGASTMVDCGGWDF